MTAFAAKRTFKDTYWLGVLGRMVKITKHLKGMDMRLVLLFITFIIITGCSTTLTKEAAQVTFHSEVNSLLDDCKK